MNYGFLSTQYVGFPGLGLDFKINPVAFTIFGKEIYWYGIIIALAMVVAVWYAIKDAKRVGLPEETVPDVVLWGAPIGIICARLYYVLFSWSDYAKNPVSMLYIWEGGLAIYGGVIGGFITGLVYCRIKKIDFFKLADIAAVAFLIGQAIGRWGNFVNVEAYGGATTLPWRMEIIPSEAQFGGKLTGVHPTFLYESLWNLAGFVILHSIRKKKPFTGFMFWSYLLWYGLGRVLIEGLRTDSLMLGDVRISQLLAGACIIVSAAVIIFKWKNAGVKEITTEETTEISLSEDPDREENHSPDNADEE